VRRRKDGSLVDVALTVSPIKDGEGRIIGASKIARDITEKKRAEEQRELMMRELSHRSKNLLAMVQGMMQQAARHARDLPSFEQAFAERLKGLARSHDLLVHSNWNGASLIDLVRAQCGFIDDAGAHTITADGTTVILTPAAAQTIGLALYELATNSVKHGALSVPQGQIHIAWNIDQGDGPSKFVFVWSEREGPSVTTPEGRGFGSVVLETIAPRALGGTASLEFPSEGVAWKLEVPLDNLTKAADTLKPAG
jgi:two-component sensor histidine kinase